MKDVAAGASVENDPGAGTPNGATPPGFHVEFSALVSNGDVSVVLGPFDSYDDALLQSGEFATVDRIEVLKAYVRDIPNEDPFDGEA